MAGLAEKMLEYVLETRVDAQEDGAELDVFLEDLVLTHIIYLPTNTLCNYLKHYYSRAAEVSSPPTSVLDRVGSLLIISASLGSTSGAG